MHSTKAHNFSVFSISEKVRWRMDLVLCKSLMQSSISFQEVTEELIFESIENASGNGSDYGSCEEKDPVYEEVSFPIGKLNDSQQN